MTLLKLAILGALGLYAGWEAHDAIKTKQWGWLALIMLLWLTGVTLTTAAFAVLEHGS